LAATFVLAVGAPDAEVVTHGAAEALADAAAAAAGEAPPDAEAHEPSTD
jgi:hypothetical protein